MPPVHALPGLLGLAVLPGLLLGARSVPGAYGRAFAFLYAYFLVGLYWVGIAFYADAERFGALAVPGVLALCAILAALQGLPLAVLRARAWSSPAAAALAFAVLWLLGEGLRGFLTQFPWNPLSLTWSAFDALMQPIAWFGGKGLGLVTALALAWLGLFWAVLERRRTAALGTALLLLMPAGLGALRLALVEPSPPTETRLRVVQANVAQAERMDPANRRGLLERHMRLTAADLPDQSYTAAIWSESAIQYRLDPDPEGRRYIAQSLPEGAVLLAGSDYYNRADNPPILRNSVYALTRSGAIAGRYDKVNLVPFGEFLPFRDIFGAIGLEALAVGSIDFSPGPGRRTLDVGGLPPFSPLVCYEAAFEGAATDGTGRAEWLLNVTNDAWFGNSSGPYQHLAMARLRAVETGLPLVRAANTGVSVVTDALGRVQARLGLFETGVIDAALPAPLPPPLIARLPVLPWLLALVMAITALVLERRGRSRVFG